MVENSTLQQALPPLSRRGFLAAGFGAVTLAAVDEPAWASSEGAVLPLVDPLPAGDPDRALFDPREQVLAGYLTILSPLANSVIDDDPVLYGWMPDGWWRSPTEPFNSRIMEHVATFSWFYSHERSWNPYYQDANLLGRLDAALQYYLGLPHDDGSWTEYSTTEHSLAATGFGTVALSATLRDLKSANALPERRTQIEAALRAGAAWLMDPTKKHWGPPIPYVNQVIAGCAGVAQTAEVLGDPSIAAPLTERLDYVLAHGQAPAGNFHEPLGYDAGYNFEVMLPDLAHVYELTGHPALRTLAERFADFFGRVVVMEPGSTSGFHLAAACSRNSATMFVPQPSDGQDRSALARALLPDVPALAAFLPSADDKVAARTAWAADPAPVPALTKPNTSPRLYMHVTQAPDGVSSAQRDAHIAAQRYLTNGRYTELREGTIAQHFLFVRRPSYYLGGLFGVRASNRNRMGPGLLWHPAGGTMLLSLNNAVDDFWATILSSGGLDSARTDVVATYYDGPDASAPQISRADVNAVTGVFTVRYSAAASAITTDVSFWDDGLRRSVQASGAAIDRIPLVLRPSDTIQFANGSTAVPGSPATTTTTGVAIVRIGHRLSFSWSGDRTVRIVPTDRTFPTAVPSRHHLLEIDHSGQFQVDVAIVNLAQTQGQRVRFGYTAATEPSGATYRTAFSVVNLEPQPVDLLVMSQGVRRDVLQIPPGVSARGVISTPATDGRPNSVAFVATTRRNGRTQVTTETVRV